MTDIEIIEAFTRLIFRFEGKATDMVILYCAYDLIKQQKAEIDQFADIGKMYSEIRAEAIKEFAEMLKQDIVECEENPLKNRYQVLTPLYIDNLVKEMEKRTSVYNENRENSAETL